MGMVAGKALSMGGPLRGVESHFDWGEGVELLASGVCLRLVAVAQVRAVEWQRSRNAATRTKSAALK
jgi:hypothetical protein